MKRFGSVVLAVVFLAGCHVDPGQARDAVVSAYGFILDLQAKHLQMCQADSKQAVCVEINKAVSVQRLASAALNTYCAGPPGPGEVPYTAGGSCSIQPGVETRLKTSLQDLDSVMKDIKKLAGS